MIESDSSEPAKSTSKGGFSKVLIGIIAFVLGIGIGAVGFYFLGPVSHTNFEKELSEKTKQIKILGTKIDSLSAELKQAKEISPSYTAILKKILDPDTLNEIISLGTAVGGQWSVKSADDVVFLEENLLYLRMDDGHLAGMALVKAPDTGDTKSWRTLWSEYE